MIRIALSKGHLDCGVENRLGWEKMTQWIVAVTRKRQDRTVSYIIELIRGRRKMRGS
jgi:hypothetical protein